jgi:tripeptide aminopeptidase
MHFGYAKGKMQNAVIMASNFIQLLPRNESPEATDGYDGYYCATNITGNVEAAHVDIILRDFSTAEIERRIATLKTFAQCIESQFPGGKVILNIRKQYSNMKEEIDRFPEVLENLKQAVKNAGGNAKLSPIRGGTDGSRLTELGIPTPNIFTGGHNFHSRQEWLSLNQLELSCKTLIELAKLYAR